MDGRENSRNSPGKNPHIAAIDGAITEARDGLDDRTGAESKIQDPLIHIGRYSQSLKYSVYAHCIEKKGAFMTAKNSELVTTVSILTRRLREGKTYDDFRKAWYHTTGFGVKDKEVEGTGNRMFSMINVFDPREVVVVGFSTTTLEQLKDALDIDVKVRGENPLDDIIEPDIGRKFCALISEDDFSAVGNIPYKLPTIAGKETDMAEFAKTMQSLQGLFGAASKKRDAVNEARKKRNDPSRYHFKPLMT